MSDEPHSPEIAAVVRDLQAARFDLHDEKACQAGIAAWLRPLYPALRREPRLSRRDIPDFMIGGLVIEVKMNRASPSAIEAQLQRYADHDTVSALILATNRAVRLPRLINGKPVMVASLGRAYL